MELKRAKRVSVLFLVLAVIVVFGMTYAAFSQELSIRGNAVVRSSKWQIKFNNLRTASLNGTAKQLTQPAIVGDTSIGDYSVSLTTPGDSLSYTFDVVNNGDYNARVSGVDIRTPMCTGSGSNSTNDANNVCGKLHYTLKYSGTDNNVGIGDELQSYQTRTMVLTLSYEEFDDANLLAKADVAVSNLGITITYAQDGAALVNSDGSTPYTP